MLGEPHFIEKESARTFGGDEDAWAYTLSTGQRVVVLLRVPYNVAVICADPPDLEPVLRALKISPSDSRLTCYPDPVAVL